MFLHCAAMKDVPESRDAATYQIGEIATRIGLSQRTIRHYDDLGIVKPSARTVGGFRLYTESDVQRFLLIKPMKPLGIGLDGVRAVTESLDVLADAASTEEQLAAARERLSATVALIAERRAELEEALATAVGTVSELEAAADAAVVRLAQLPALRS